MRKLALSGLMAFGLATGAHAADFSSAPATFDWSGFYAGAQAVYTWSNAELLFTDDYYSNLDPDGFSGGLYAGYNFQTGSGVVLGLEADFTISGADASGSPTYNPAGVPSVNLWDSEINWTAAARLRAGYAFDRALIYIAGGFAAAELGMSEGGFDFTETYTGWTVGAGLDYAVTDHLIVRAEYRYSDLGDAEYRGPDAVWFDIELKAHEVRAGLAYKF